MLNIKSLYAHLATALAKRADRQAIQMLQIRKNNLRAFTLIEVMVVVAIIGIMATLVVASLGNGRIARELETNAREFASVVREAQNYALTGKQAVAGTDPCRFRMEWAGPSYTLTYWYKNESGVCNKSSLMATYTLKDGVVFPSAVDKLDFALPYANPDFSGTKTVLFSKSGFNHSVCITEDGRISDQATAVCP